MISERCFSRTTNHTLWTTAHNMWVRPESFEVHSHCLWRFASQIFTLANVTAIINFVARGLNTTEWLYIRILWGVIWYLEYLLAISYHICESRKDGAWNIRWRIEVEARHCSALFDLFNCFVVNIKVWLFLIDICNIFWILISFILSILKESDLCFLVLSNLF